MAMIQPRFRKGQSESGMVLISCLAILSGLILAGAGVRMMLQNDLRVSANLRGSTEAFYFSAAGLEWGKQEIARAANFPPVLINQARSFSSGAFTVSFQSPTVVGPLTTRVVVRSAGASRDAKHLLQAQIRKSYDLADAALVLRGGGTGVGLSAADIYISGADHDDAGTPIPGAKARSGVSTGDEGARSLFAQALGTRPDVLDGSSGAGALAQSGYLSSTFIAQFAGELCAAPAAFVHTVPGVGALTFENQGWGSQAAPQVHCVEGLAASGDAVTFAGNGAGAGILVVRNADLVLSGTFRWEGLVIVTGGDVSFKTTGASLKQLFGAVVVNETGVPGAERKILDIEGAVRIGFSRAALARTVQLVPSTAFGPAYGALPALISQDYWRAEGS
jgi:hypothetical protein